VEQVTDRDIAVTADIPLAARCLEKGARALDAKGRVYSAESIGDALAGRELMAHLRAMGEMVADLRPSAPGTDRPFFSGWTT